MEPRCRLAGTNDRRLSLLAACALAVAAAVLRAWQLNDSLWLDELHTAWIVAGEISELAPRARIGNQSPAFFYLPKAAVAMLGMSEWSLRLPSFLAGVALLPLGYLATWRWTRCRSGALFAALLIAIDHDCVFYSQEARPYAMVQLVGLAQVLLFWELLRAPRLWWRAGFVLATAALFHLHYTSALLVAGELAAYVWLARFLPTVTAGSGTGGAAEREHQAGTTGRGAPLPYRPPELALDTLAAVVLGLPAVPHVAQIAAHRGDWSAIAAAPTLVNVVRLFPLTPYVLCPLAGLLALRAARRRARLAPALGPGDPRAAVLLACWFLVPLALAWLLTLTHVAPVLMRRYLMFLAVAPMAGCGALLARYPGRTAKLAAATAVLVLLTATQERSVVRQFLRDGRLIGDRRQDWRGAVGFVRRQARGSAAPVLVRSGWLEADRLRARPDPLFRDYCLSPVKGIYRLDTEPRELIPLPRTRAGELNASAISAIRRRGEGWFLISGSSRTRRRVITDVLDCLARCRMKASLHWLREFGEVLVFHLRIEQDPSSAAGAMPAGPLCGVWRFSPDGRHGGIH